MASIAEDDEKRREALRKAGQEYFDKVLQQASAGKDPFSKSGPGAPVASGGAPGKNTVGKGRKATAAAIALENELAEVGSVLSKVHLVLTLVVFIVSGSSAMIFSKLSLEILPAPATILTMHMVPIALVAYIAALFGAWETTPFSLPLLRGVIPFAALHAGMALMVLFALEHMRVETVLGVTAAFSPVVTNYVTKLLVDPNAALDALPKPKLIALAVGFVGACLCLAAEGKNTVKAALWLIPWFVFLALERATDAVQAQVLLTATEQRGLRVKVHDGLMKVLNKVYGERDEEAQSNPVTVLSAGDRLLYCNFLPILPVALLAVIFQEGNIFTDAELHVHSVSMLGYSVVAGVCVSVSSILLRQMLDTKMFTLATICTQLGTLVIILIHMDGSEHGTFEAAMEGMVSSLICILAGTAFKDYPFTAE